MKLAKVRKLPADLQAVHTLREAIISGAIAQGERITESELASQMAVSRATIRSALQQLASEGLTTLKRYSGWSVLTLSADDVQELYNLRSALERLAARLVAEKMDPVKKTKIQKSLSQLTRSCEEGDHSKIAESDFDFHKQIILLADSDRLATQYELIEPQIRVYIGAIDTVVSESDVLIDQHTKIAEAIIGGNVEAAGSLSEEHNLIDGKKFYHHLQREEA
jgi:DNA-binding GntR family transcriptional regulator